MKPNVYNSATSRNTSGDRNKNNLFTQNRRELGFIPALAVFVMFIFSIAGGFWYVKLSNKSNSDSSFSVFQLVNLPDTQSQNNSNVLSATDNKQDNLNITLFQSSSQNCDFNYVNQKPNNITDKINKFDSGWWIVGANCYDKNLTAVQILKLNSDQYNLLQTNFSPNNLQLLDQQNNIYAAVYMLNTSSTVYSFKTYVKYLVEPIFSDLNYLKAEDIFDTKYIDNYTYFLEGGCRAGDDKLCNLWRQDNFSGQYELLTQDVADTGKGGTNQLADSQSIKFAKTQDVVNALNLIIVNWKNQYPEFKLVTLDQSTWNPIQSYTIYPAQKGYLDYFR